MEFLLRRGSLETGRGLFAGAAMQEGARIHRMLQKKEGPGYKAEAALSREIEIDPGQLIAAGAPAEQEKKYILRLEGRADGIYHSGEESAGISQGDGGPAGISTDGKEPAGICHSGKEAAGSISQGDGEPAGLWMIDEIKTVFRGFRDLREPEQVHLAQARCYAFIYAEKEGLDRIGIAYEKTAVGDRYVYENMKENDHLIGGEQSGHIIFRKYAHTGDGLITAIMLMGVLIDTQLPLSVLASEVTMYPQILKNVVVDDKDGTLADPAVQASVERCTAELGADGRVLLRKSGTEPVLRVMSEAGTLEECEKQVDSIIAAMEASGHLIEVRKK